MSSMKKSIVSIMFVLLVFSVSAQKKEAGIKMSWESLEQHEIPEWYKDAKFGIYAHLGVYCVPSHNSEWYPRYMYTKDHPVVEYHEKTYGPVSEFGYHDFIPMFKLENFDANEWAELYKRSGAKFAGPVAEHHDGFSMWDSKINRWNAKDMGPKRDVVGELVKAIRKRDMKVITSFHHGFNLEGYYPTMEGTATADPKYADLYGKLPLEEGYERWFTKLKEVIDNYQPDQIWFDWGLRAIPMEYRRKFASYYYSKEKEWDKEVIITRKLDQLPDGVGVLDYEGGSARDVTPELWQTDQSTGGHIWSWRDGIEIRSPKAVLHELINVVSKNGILLLNICPDASGSIPGGQKEMLYHMGDWLKINGEAIYGTRAWRVSGEGPRMYGHYGYYMFHSTAPQKNPINVRYTQKDGNVYAICMNWPDKGFTFDKIQVKGNTEKSKITLLGHGEVSFKVNDEKLSIDPLKINKEEFAVKDAYVFKLENFELDADPFSKLEVLSLNANNATPTGQILVRKGNLKDGVMERNLLNHWSNPSDKAYWLVDVKTPGEYYVRGEMATRFHAARMVLKNGEDELRFETEPRDKYGEGVITDYGTISFKKTGLYRVELGLEDLLDFPGIQSFWQLELAPVD
jgi:alpha-L-fucosidase